MRILALLALFIVLYPGCADKDVPPETPADTTSAIGHYGAGTLNFSAEGGGGEFAVNGKYKPSDQFATDSSSQGAGGFVRDTMVFQRRIGAMVAGYIHHLAGGVLNERWLVMTLHGTSNVVNPGDFPFAPSNAEQAGQAAYLYFALSDSVTFHDIYVPRSGTVTLSSYNRTTRRLQGTFTGTLWGPFPDTLRQIQVSGGGFDLTCVSGYYIP
ncbi:MAG TPA: hypothetical protein VI215_00670 [Bacteroidota bacterium]|jgi:hypothetical protein